METRTTILDGEDTQPQDVTGDILPGKTRSEQEPSNEAEERGKDLMQDEEDTDGAV